MSSENMKSEVTQTEQRKAIDALLEGRELKSAWERIVGEETVKFEEIKTQMIQMLKRNLENHTDEYENNNDILLAILNSIHDYHELSLDIFSNNALSETEKKELSERIKDRIIPFLREMVLQQISNTNFTLTSSTYVQRALKVGDLPVLDMIATKNKDLLIEEQMKNFNQMKGVIFGEMRGGIFGSPITDQNYESLEPHLKDALQKCNYDPLLAIVATIHSVKATEKMDEKGNIENEDEIGLQVDFLKRMMKKQIQKMPDYQLTTDHLSDAFDLLRRLGDASLLESIKEKRPELFDPNPKLGGGQKLGAGALGALGGAITCLFAPILDTYLMIYRATGKDSTIAGIFFGTLAALTFGIVTSLVMSFYTFPYGLVGGFKHSYNTGSPGEGISLAYQCYGGNSMPIYATYHGMAPAADTLALGARERGLEESPSVNLAAVEGVTPVLKEALTPTSATPDKPTVASPIITRAYDATQQAAADARKASAVELPRTSIASKPDND